MKSFLFLILVFTGVLSFSQKLDSVQQYKVLSILDTMDFAKHYRGVIDSCDKYLEYDFSVCEYEATLYSFKAKALEYLLDSVQTIEIYIEEDELYDSISDILISQILALHQNAISSCKDCEFIHFKRKYLFEYSNGIVNKDDFKLLKKQGYFGIEDYWSISPLYTIGKNKWIGVEVSANHLQHFFIDEEMIAFQFIAMGFQKSISTKKGWGMNLSFASASVYWINVRPFNFSYLNNGNTGTFGYSPEIGFQFWYLHLNAGYNLAFKKSMRSYEKLYFTAKFDIPFYRF